MDYVSIIISAVVSIAVLFLLTRLMGEKQISQLSMFDYITGISIGSIAAEMATEIEEPEKPLLAMVVFGIIALGISVLTNKSLAARKLLNGKAVILLDGGQLYKNNFKKARLNINEFLACARVAGYFDLAQIETAYMEHNGSISFLPKAAEMPPTASDMNIPAKQNHSAFSFIIDGKPLPDNIRRAGRDMNWLRKECSAQGYSDYGDIFYAAFSDSGELSVYAMKPKTKNTDMFE